MLDAKTAAQVENSNASINERLNDTNFRIQHGQGGFTLEDECDLQQWDPYYRGNDPTSEEYGTANGETPLNDAEDLNHDDDFYNKYIGAKLIIDKKSNNGGNLANVTRQDTGEYGEKIGQEHRTSMLDTRKFEVELKNVETEKITKNQIAANLYSQLDDKGRDILQFKVIIEHNMDGSDLTKETVYILY